MPTRATLRNYVREETLIESTDLANSVLNDVLDRAIYDVATRFDWPFLGASVQVTTIAGDQAIKMPSDWMRTLSVVRNGRRTQLAELSFREAMEYYGGDPPESSEAKLFFIFNGELYLLPVPSSGELDAYTHYYLKQPTLMANDTDTPEWTDEFHDVLVPFAVAWVWRREEDLTKATDAEERYRARLNDMAAFYLNQAADSPYVWGQRTKRALRGVGIGGNMPWLYDV